MSSSQWWYSWFGANWDIFNMIYGRGVETLGFLFPALEAIGDYENIYYYATLTLCITTVQYLVRKMNGYRYDAYYIRSQTAWLLSFVTSFIIMVGVVGVLKDFVAFPRPFAEHVGSITQLFGNMPSSKAYQSFPSGHAAFTAFVISIFWSRTISLFKPFLILLLVLMCWYRVSIGVHYPADVLYGALIGLSAVAISRSVWCKLFKVWR